MTPDLVIGVDCSTTAAKAVAWTASGRAVAEGRSAFPLSTPQPGWGEQDPTDWWRAVVKAIGDVSQKIDVKRVAGLAVTHQRETFVCLDANGDAIRPAMLWLDTRAGAEIEAFGSDKIHETTGKPPNTATSWYKLLWLKRHEPQTLARTRWVVDVHGYIVHRLTGQWRTSYGSVDPMGLLDMSRLALDDGLLKEAGLSAGQIPAIYAPGEKLGELPGDIAAMLGLTTGLPVFAGTGDGQAAGLGANITSPGVAALNLGTGIVSGMFNNTYRWCKEFRTMTGGVPGTYMPETFIGGGTYNVSWFVQQFANIPERPFGLELTAERILELAAGTIPAGAEGLLALPYLSGALSPYWDRNARGAFVGLSPQHGKAHVYRAILEGLAMEQRLSTTGAEQVLGAPVERIRLMGGGSRSALWCQILADILKRPVDVSREIETTCLGAGMLAASGVGLHSGVAEAAAAMSGVAQMYQPDPPISATYDKLFEVYRRLYPCLRETFAQLHEAAGPQF